MLSKQSISEKIAKDEEYAQKTLPVIADQSDKIELTERVFSDFMLLKLLVNRADNRNIGRFDEILALSAELRTAVSSVESMKNPVNLPKNERSSRILALQKIRIDTLIEEERRIREIIRRLFSERRVQS
jgi:hypothetical protein